MAEADPRVVSGAIIGSMAHRPGDRWSDIDLTFGVVDDVPVTTVLDEWTATLVAEEGAIKLFDVPAGTSIYRVFLMPGCLQFDLSFTPAASFGATGPNFRLLFGTAIEKPRPRVPAAPDMLGEAVHHCLRARFGIERGRFWLAEYWISSARDSALTMACRQRGLPVHYGRGFDDLPAELLAGYREALVRAPEREELLRALGSTIELLLAAAAEAPELAAAVAPELKKLAAAWD
jgi:hypothetical protein